MVQIFICHNKHLTAAPYSLIIVSAFINTWLFNTAIPPYYLIIKTRLSPLTYGFTDSALLSR